MTEESIEPAEMEESVEVAELEVSVEPAKMEEGVEPAEMEKAPLPEEPVKDQRPKWVTALIAVAGIVLFCCVLAICVTAGIALFSGGEAATPTAPVAVTVPVQATEPVRAYLQINEPVQGAVLDITQPVGVSGTGAGLPEGNVVVQAIDSRGNVLAEQPTTLQGPDVGTGGEGTWRVELTIQAEPGTAGRIVAFSRSPADNSTIAEASVEVSLGRTPAVQPYIRIDEPAQGAVLDIERRVRVSGSGAGLPEGNVVVQAIDRDGNVLAEQPTTLQGRDVGTGGEGTWQVELTIQTEPGMAGRIVAFSKSPADNSTIAEDGVEVSFGRTPAVEPYLLIDEPAEGAIVDTADPIPVSGRGGGLPEGNVVVQAIDSEGRVLAEEATTLEGRDVASGGEGTWSLQLDVQAPGGTAGRLVAFSPSPVDGSNVATAIVGVTFGEEEQGPSLEGPTWVLDGTIRGTEITAVFNNGLISGSAGCNNYTGRYVTGSATDENTIRISGVTATGALCDAEITDQETRYLNALTAVTRYTVQGDELTLYFPGGRLVYYSQ